MSRFSQPSFPWDSAQEDRRLVQEVVGDLKVSAHTDNTLGPLGLSIEQLLAQVPSGIDTYSRFMRQSVLDIQSLESSPLSGASGADLEFGVKQLNRLRLEGEEKLADSGHSAEEIQVLSHSAAVAEIAVLREGAYIIQDKVISKEKENPSPELQILKVLRHPSFGHREVTTDSSENRRLRTVGYFRQQELGGLKHRLKMLRQSPSWNWPARLEKKIRNMATKEVIGNVGTRFCGQHGGGPEEL